MGKSLLLEDGGDLAEEDLTLKVNSSYAARLEVEDEMCICKKFAALSLPLVCVTTKISAHAAQQAARGAAPPAREAPGACGAAGGGRRRSR